MDLSICIAYYGQPECLTRCLASIFRNRPRCDFEVVVVDDASPVPCRETVRTMFPEVRVVENASNRGFAGATNRGIAESRGRHVLLLNSDTELLPGAADSLVEALDAEADLAAVGPMLLSPDGSFQPQCKRGVLSPASGLAYSLGLDRLWPRSAIAGEYLMRYADPLTAHDVKGLSGACMCVRRAAIRDGGPLDESFGMYGEDLDWCYRMRARGWRVAYRPQARVIHSGGRGGSATAAYRNLYLYHRAIWRLFRRYPRTRYFVWYSWAAWLALALRFGLCVAGNGLRRQKRVGTRKGGRGPHDAAKRAFDVALSATGLVASAPLWLLIAVVKKLEDGGPVFYRQVRVGRGGAPFPLLKFRSMRDGAEREVGSVWASEHDERVTPFGRLLRSTALDELPQLWNILEGSMSFVGPRAERPEFTEQFRGAIDGYDRRHAIRPGLTGLAQIYGRYDLEPRHKLRYDLLYVKRRSLVLDLRLIFVSFLISFLGRWGARRPKLPRLLTHRRLGKRRSGARRLRVSGSLLGRP